MVHSGSDISELPRSALSEFVGVRLPSLDAVTKLKEGELPSR